MQKTAFLIILALCCTLAVADPDPYISYTTFGSMGTEIFNVSNSSDSNWENCYYEIGFSPDLNGSSLYAWCFPWTTSSTKLSTVVKRTLNATIIAMGNDTSESSVIGPDATITPTSPIPAMEPPIFAGAPGSFAFVTTGLDSNGAFQVYASVIQSNGTTVATQNVTNSPVYGSSSGSTYVQTTHYPMDIWYDSGVFYFLWYTDVYTWVGSASESYHRSALYLQGVYATNGSTYFNSSVVKLEAFPSSAEYSQVLDFPVAHSMNTNGSNLYFVYKDIYATPEATFLLTVPKNTTSNPTIKASLLAVDTSKLTYYPAGIITSDSTYGAALELANTTGASTVYTIVLFLNGSNTGIDSGFTAPSGTQMVTSAQGTAFGSGFIIFASFEVGSSTIWAYQTYYANATVETGMVSFASVKGETSLFEDADGYLWFGYGTNDASSAGQGYLAKFGGELIAGTVEEGILLGVSASGNILKTFLVFVSIVTGSLFIF